MAELTAPLRNIFRERPGREPPEVLATMSRPRFITFQVFSLLTVVITCFTLFAVTLLKNEEMSNKILNWGNAATCMLNATTEHQLLSNETTTPKDWIDMMDFLLQLKGQCLSAPNSSVYPP